MPKEAVMFETKETSVKFSQELEAFIDEWKQKDGNLIMVLHRVQEDYGYIPREVALELSKKLAIPLAKIYGVLTFYHLFKLKKPGKYQISVCMGTACYLKGGEDIIQGLEELLDLPVNGITADEQFSLEAVRCVGCCGLAPVMTINGEVFGRLTKKELPEIIAKFQGN